MVSLTWSKHALQKSSLCSDIFLIHGPSQRAARWFGGVDIRCRSLFRRSERSTDWDRLGFDFPDGVDGLLVFGNAGAIQAKEIIGNMVDM